MHIFDAEVIGPLVLRLMGGRVDDGPFSTADAVNDGLPPGRRGRQLVIASLVLRVVDVGVAPSQQHQAKHVHKHQPGEQEEFVGLQRERVRKSVGLSD